VEPQPPDGDVAIEDPDEWIERRRGERREIDIHRAELVEALDRAAARGWRRDILFAATGALVGALVTVALIIATS
jgi:hypothetical protein